MPWHRPTSQRRAAGTSLLPSSRSAPRCCDDQSDVGRESGLYFNRMWTPTASWAPKVAAPTSSCPLLTSVPTDTHVEAMVVRWLTNTSEFGVAIPFSKHGMPSVSRSSPTFKDNRYWRGRAVSASSSVAPRSAPVPHRLLDFLRMAVGLSPRDLPMRRSSGAVARNGRRILRCFSCQRRC